jgi:hypothetical protein
VKKQHQEISHVKGLDQTESSDTDALKALKQKPDKTT